MAYTLYKGTSAWGLPSYSAASIQVEVRSGHWLVCQEQVYLIQPLTNCQLEYYVQQETQLSMYSDSLIQVDGQQMLMSDGNLI